MPLEYPNDRTARHLRAFGFVLCMSSFTGLLWLMLFGLVPLTGVAQTIIFFLLSLFFATAPTTRIPTINGPKTESVHEGQDD